MSREFLDRISSLSPKRLALLAAQLNERVEAAREPIAVIGMGCRFPGGVTDPDGFWRLLSEGRDAIREVPSDRYDIDEYFDPDPDAAGRISARAGGFLDRVADFDPAFFGITPREAATLDPQQRLLLEVTWEALEHAGISPAELAGSNTGVFTGISNGDHFLRVLARGNDAIDAYLASGNAHSVAAGRISYFLGLHGPAYAVDTACSSSLAALHLGVKSLRNGESRITLVSGVNVMCSPETTIALSRSHMLAPDGRCKTFDAAADGFSRGEGCGVLVLKRLSDAKSDHDRIFAVIRGTAVNQDGRSGGLTVPNGPAQEAVIRAALADAGIEPGDVGYVEAHGTGTSLGDPIEVRALAGALGAGRKKDEPLVIGSVKTNFGHLESAAGIAGVMKVVLSLVHGRIPKHLHFQKPSPHIAWTEYPVSVASEARAWPRGARRRLAGVSSFGFSGTNAHAIIEEAPPEDAEPSGERRGVHCLPLSAKTEEALFELAARSSDALARSSASFSDAVSTAGAGRAHFAERLAVVTDDPAEARAALEAFTSGGMHPALERGTAPAGGAPEIVFLFTGQGSQYPGMGQALYQAAPVFRDVIDRCDALLGPDGAGRTLKSVIAPGPSENAPLHETAWTQPALFAVEYALTELWRSWGVEPAAVIGHSAGEYVAAAVAGVFSMEDGLRLIAARGRLLQALPAGGAMAAVFAPMDEVARAVAPVSDRVAVAALNAPDSAVVSGEARAVEALLASFEQRNVKGHRLFVSFAAHSPLVEPAMEGMAACARAVPMQAPRIPVAWNVTGGAPLPGGAPDATYWKRHLREPVRFAEGIASLATYPLFLEVGPHPVLAMLAERNLGGDAGQRLLGSLRRGKDDWRELTTTVGRLYTRGAKINWAGVTGTARPKITWPTYPFQRRSFWIDARSAGERRLRKGTRTDEPLLGEQLPTAQPIFETTLRPGDVHYLEEHRIFGAVLAAGPVFLEGAQSAARRTGGTARRGVERFVIHEALVLPEEGRILQTHLATAPDGTASFSIHSRAADGSEPWSLHATGDLVSREAKLTEADTTELTALERVLGQEESSASFYEHLAGLGVRLGEAFRGVKAVRRGNGEALTEVALPPNCANDAVVFMHPALLDAAFQTAGLAIPSSSDVYLLSGVESIDVRAPLPASFRCHARLRPSADPRPPEWRADVTLRAPAGAVLGVLRGVTLRRASREALGRVAGEARGSNLFYRVRWEPSPVVPAAAPSLVAPSRFVPAVRERFTTLAALHGLSLYEALMPELDRLSAEYAIAALRELGFDDSPGRPVTPSDEAARLGVTPRQQRLFARLLEMLAEDGVLENAGSSYIVRTSLPAVSPAARADALIARFAPNDGELRTLARTGNALARVLRGQENPLELLFPGGTFAEARKLYVDSPFARTYNGTLGETLTRALASLPAGAALRVLEIGGGTGGTTSTTVPLLGAACSKYTFTDVSPLFLERASEAYGKYPFFETALLDIERAPGAQAVSQHAYDVVIAANVLHAAADVTRAVEHAKSFLVPGGLLLLVEGTAKERWVDLTFGLTEGWWRFTDAALRPDYPLLDRSAWLGLLAQLGFEDAAAIPAAHTNRGSQQALIVARAPVATRRFTLVGGPPALAGGVAERLRSGGDAVTVIAADAPDASLLPGDDVVYLGALDIPKAPLDDAGAERRASLLGVALPIEWLARLGRRADTGRAWLVTRGAQPVEGPVPETSAWQALTWGVGRVFALEHPTRWGGLVDLPPDGTDEALVEAILIAIDPKKRVDDGEDQLAVRGGTRFRARLVPAAPPNGAPFAPRSDATYLVTGGFGGLGLLVARWLAERGARHIALLGRRPVLDSEAVRAVEALGAKVVGLAGDVADRAAMERVLGELAQSPFPLRGMFHAAAALSSGAIDALTPEQVTNMLRPKVLGTVLLEQLTRRHTLDFFVLFSSTTALLGASGLAHYAAANAFLDAFASATNTPARHVLSINWGTWEAMRLASEDAQRSYREGGLLPIRTGDALDALGRMLSATDAQGVVAEIDWSVLKPLHEARRARPFLAELGNTPAESSARAGERAPAPDVIERLARASAGARRELLVEFVLGEVAAVLGTGGDAVALDAGLFELGMDSLMSVELRKRLERGIGRTLPSTLTFNYPSVNALSGFLDDALADVVVTAPVPVALDATLPEPTPGTDTRDIDELSDEEIEARLMARLLANR